MTFIVATNVVASRPPERQPTGTPHARAKLIRYRMEDIWTLGLFSCQLIVKTKWDTKG